jgi:hypothetical protein
VQWLSGRSIRWVFVNPNASIAATTTIVNATAPTTTTLDVHVLQCAITFGKRIQMYWQIVERSVEVCQPQCVSLTLAWGENEG